MGNAGVSRISCGFRSRSVGRSSTTTTARRWVAVIFLMMLYGVVWRENRMNEGFYSNWLIAHIAFNGESGVLDYGNLDVNRDADDNNSSTTTSVPLTTTKNEPLETKQPLPSQLLTTNNPSTIDARQLYAAIAAQTVFWIMATPQSEPNVVLSTWGKYVNSSQIVFVGDCRDCSFRVELRTTTAATIVPDEPNTLWLKTRTSLLEVTKRFPHANYFVKLDMDTYVIPENVFREIIRVVFLPGASTIHEHRFPASTVVTPPPPYYVGSEMNQHGRVYAAGGAGYVVTRAALEVTEFFTKTRECQEFKMPGWYEDMFMGDCLRSCGVALRPSRAFNAHKWVQDFPHTDYPATLHDYKTRESYLDVHNSVRVHGYVIGGLGKAAVTASKGSKSGAQHRHQLNKKLVHVFNVNKR